MKKKLILCAVLVACVSAAAVLIFVINNKSGNTSESESADISKVTYSTVRMIEEKSNTEESSYCVGADLSGSDFSNLSETITDKIKQEWDTYEGLTEMQRIASSKAWGTVGHQCDTWAECEDAIGISVDNPLESVDWLIKTSHYGFGSDRSKHILVTASTQKDRTPNRINIGTSYYVGAMRITLTATLTSNSEEYSTGSAITGYADFVQTNTQTGKGIPVLIVTPDEANNLGYYSEDYYAPVAYWVKDNVFYSVRVLGNDTNKEQIHATLGKILAEF